MELMVVKHFDVHPRHTLHKRGAQSRWKQMQTTVKGRSSEWVVRLRPELKRVTDMGEALGVELLFAL